MRGGFNKGPERGDREGMEESEEMASGGGWRPVVDERHLQQLSRVASVSYIPYEVEVRGVVGDGIRDVGT